MATRRGDRPAAPAAPPRRVRLPAAALLLASLPAVGGSVVAQPPRSGPGRQSTGLDETRLKQLWREIGDEDPTKAYAAARALARGGEPCVAFLRGRIEPVLGKADPAALRRLVAELDHRQFRVRERASDQIAMLGRWAAPHLRRALRGAASEEQRLRLRALIGGCVGPLPDTDGRRRIVRAVRVLELVGTGPAKALLKSIESSPARPYVRYLQVDKYAVEAGFAPDKAEYVWGEPILHFAFAVRNVGEELLQYPEGGDYRGTGRHERHKISAVDSHGKPVPDPLAHRNGPGGGIGGPVKLPPRGTHTWLLPVSRRLTFSGPGVYTVTCKRTLNLGGQYGEKPPHLPVTTTFRLTIHPYSEARMREVIENLAAEIRAAGQIEPRRAEMVIGRAMRIAPAARLHNAMTALAGISDKAAIVHLAEWLKMPSRDARVMALVALSKFQDPRAEAAVLGALKTGTASVGTVALRALGHFRTRTALAAVIRASSDDSAGFRAAAAGALGNRVGLVDVKAAMEALVRAAQDANEPVRAAAADALGSALGKAAGGAAFDLLMRLMDDPAAGVRVRAGLAAGKLGDKRAIGKLKAHIADARVPFAEVLMQLGEPFDPEWVTPVIRAKQKHPMHSWQNVIHMVRRHGGKWAAPALIRCLDFDKPTANYYNYTLCWQIGAAGGPRVTYHHDFDSDGTPEQIRQNAAVLKKLKAWADDFYRTNPRGPKPNAAGRKEDQLR